jgi:plasmid stabilization system protein ParE
VGLRSVRFHPQAADEVQRAYNWYHERNPSAALAFCADLEQQVHGVGPWAITYVNPADDPRKQ